MEIAGAKKGYGLKNRIMFGVAEFYSGGCFVIINTFFSVFLVKSLGMPIALVGTIPLVGKIWDAITDPIMGNITDRTRSRFGPKRFYILIGGIISAITFVLMWLTIPTKSTIGLYIFYLFMYCLFSTGYTIISVPYNGLLPDMIDDYAIRAKFSNMRMIWSTLGSMVSGLVPTILIKDTTVSYYYLEMGILFGIIYLLVSLITFAGTWEYIHEPVKNKMSDSFSQAAAVYRSKSFVIFIIIYLSGQCGMDFVSGMAVYYVEDVLAGKLMYMMAVLLISQLVGMVIWGPVMYKKSKKFTLLLGAPLRIIATLILLRFSYEGASLIPILICTAFIGLGNAATLTSIFAIMADMADVDELITSIHRPGTVSGMATFTRKISSGLSAAAIGFLLSAVGYDEDLASSGLRQSLSTQQGIAYIYVFVPVILVAILLIASIVFPMTSTEFATIKKEIERHKGLDSSVTSDEEKIICEKVTGISYDKLWNPDNAKTF